jgi:hypothetical protein
VQSCVDFICFHFLMPFNMLNPFLWKTMLYEVIFMFKTKFWSSSDCPHGHVQFILMLYNFHKMLLFVLLCLNVMSIVNIPTLLVLCYKALH